MNRNWIHTFINVRLYVFVWMTSFFDSNLNVNCFKSCISFFLSQLTIFTVQHHPEHTWFTQCANFNYFDRGWQEKSYNMASLVLLYFAPLMVIAFCYARICWLSFGRSAPTGGGHGGTTSGSISASSGGNRLTVPIAAETPSSGNIVENHGEYSQSLLVWTLFTKATQG